VILQGRAERIEMAGGRVNAVILGDGRRLPCSHLVHAGDPAALANGLLGQKVQAAVPRRAVHPRSHSAWVWAFAAKPKGLPLAYHNVMFAADPHAEFDQIARGEMPRDPSLYLCAQDRATGTPAGPERFEVILNAPAAAADGRPRPLEEDDLCRHRTFQTFDRFGLSFDPVPQTTTLTGPDRFAAMFPGSRGAIYGLSPQGLTATFRRPGARTIIPGLYMAGGGVHPGAGIPMATLSGRHAAEAIMADRALTSRSAQTAMPGGTSTGSATMAATRSRSSPS
jgi:1-hydroxycarotenoid 3,4-desaturase